MSDEPIPLAVVGIGGYGANLLKALAEAAEDGLCRIAAAADARLDALPEPAQRLRDQGVELYRDAVEMFQAQQGRCRAVYIASGIDSHAPLTVVAARHGYHVHLEKPPAATVQEVDEMLDALDAAGRMCLVGFQSVHGHMRLVLEALAGEKLGRVESLCCSAGWPRTRAYYRRNDWAGRLKRGDRWVLDGPATNALAHQLAHMLMMASGRMGELATPTAVRAELYAAGAVESHNTAAIEVATAEGPVLRLLVSHATQEQFGPVIHVRGERGRAFYNHGRESGIDLADGTEQRRPTEHEEAREMVRNFLQAVRDDRPEWLGFSLREARKFVVALDAAHESSGRIHRIGGEHWRLVDEGSDDERVVVEGLDDAFSKAEAAATLLSDLPDRPPWAVPTAGFDAAGYRRFPQQFTAE